MRIKHSISTSIAVIAASLGFFASNAQASLITWTLDGVTPFQFGDTANGDFTVDQAIANLPPGPNPLAGWNIMITGGSNPAIPNITFTDSDTGCLVACARVFTGNLPTSIDFRTPLAADNTFYELVLSIGAVSDELLFPTSAELVVLGLPESVVYTTTIQYNQYRPTTNDVMGLLHDDLTTTGRITTAQAVSEPAAFSLLTVGFAALSLVRCWRTREGRTNPSRCQETSDGSPLS